MYRFRLFFVILCIFFGMKSMAQSKFTRMLHKADSTLSLSYNKVNYDTAYISRPEQRFTVKLMANMSRFEIEGKGKDMSADWKNKPQSSINIEASYRDLSVGFGVNISGLGGKKKDYEFNLNNYSNRFSIDASYLVSKSVSGDTRVEDISYRLDEGMIKWKILNITANYTFNYRKFSVPAAFSQSYFQKRSAGSLLAGITYQRISLKLMDEYVSDGMDIRLAVNYLSIGAGYGYNFVPNKRWLFHLSSLPTLVVYSKDVSRMDGERSKTRVKFPTFIINARAAIIYNFNRKQFVGITLVGNKLINREDGITTEQNKWLAKAFFGFRW